MWADVIAFLEEPPKWPTFIKNLYCGLWVDRENNVYLELIICSDRQYIAELLLLLLQSSHEDNNFTILILGLSRDLGQCISR